MKTLALDTAAAAKADHLLITCPSLAPDKHFPPPSTILVLPHQRKALRPQTRLGIHYSWTFSKLAPCHCWITSEKHKILLVATNGVVTAPQIYSNSSDQSSRDILPCTQYQTDQGGCSPLSKSKIGVDYSSKI
jgi:hypothetical protein